MAIQDFHATCTPEQLKEIASKAGKASGAARRKKRELKNYLEAALELMDENGVDNYTQMTIALINKAISGDVQAYNTIRDTIGQKPVDEVNLSSNKITINIDGD